MEVCMMYMYSMKNFIKTFLRVYILLCQKGQIWQDIPDPAMTGLNSCGSDWIRIHSIVCHTPHVQPEHLLIKHKPALLKSFGLNVNFNPRDPI
jgi:hypothetical protein